MKTLVKSIVIVLLVLVNTLVFAQAKKRTTKKGATTRQTTTPKSTGNPYQNNNSNANPYSNNNNSTPSGNANTNTAAKPDTTGNPKKALPYFIMPNSGGGLFDTVKASLRTDDAIGKNYVKDRYPLPYDFIREDDAVFKERLWSEIDIREKMNEVFGYSADEDNGNQRFISIIMNAVRNGDVVAFDANDDRFTTPLTKQEAMKAFGGGIDTVPRRDIDGNIIGYEVRARQIQADSIYKFRIKEDIIFDKESSRMVRRILGIAPMMKQYASNGTAITDDLVPLFWIYYPDIRATLAKYQVYNPKNNGARMSWEDLFESHMFSSYIVKTTLNNFKDQRLKDYIRDPLFRLLEGEKIKEKIFNYEQDLWAY